MALADSVQPFDQAFYSSGPLTIAFESARLTYSELPVDLYNTGVNQILSVAAVRDHRLLHFSMADLHDRSGQYAADVSVLELDPEWDGTDPLHAHRRLRVADRQTVPLSDVQLFILRADDVRTEQTPHIEILRWATNHTKGWRRKRQALGQWDEGWLGWSCCFGSARAGTPRRRLRVRDDARLRRSADAGLADGRGSRDVSRVCLSELGICLSSVMKRAPAAQ